MSRAERLLELMQVLRRHRRPVSGAALAREMCVSIRTLYRDIASLQAQGAHIDGEPGMGYVLKPGFMLPPLMFSEEEIEALVLGSRWVADRGDAELAEAARNVLAKIGAVLPADLRNELEGSTLLIGPATPSAAGDVELPKSVAPSARSARSRSATAISRARRPRAPSGRSRWDSSIACASSRRGASCAPGCGISARIESSR